ncbi:retron St85 family effector protein [Hoeflea sp. Naph1]|uniref:retron St85 family effector protein n=1 Tax=Hoeflea sp. Naph1 TaxID=3388653 RepID=UPI0039903A3A
MAETVNDLLSFVDLNEIRFRWPSEFIFFCGGRSSNDPRDPVSLRHYLLEEKKIASRLEAKIVLAEAANQLYRDTSYKDLITYEEDIAKISRIVLLIAESSGSLAELGAFASTEHLMRKLYVIMQEEYYLAESFVRFGPVKRLENEGATRVAFYPWRVNGKGRIVKASMRQHVSELVRFINDRVSEGNKTFRFGADENSQLRDFIVVLWLAEVAQAITTERITEYAGLLGYSISWQRVQDCFYCMKLAGWMDQCAYSGSTYLIRKSNTGIVERFAFQPGSTVKDTGRWLALTQKAIAKETALKRPFLRTVMERRNG